jgi:hypothetical protein
MLQRFTHQFSAFHYLPSNFVRPNAFAPFFASFSLFHHMSGYGPVKKPRGSVSSAASSAVRNIMPYSAPSASSATAGVRSAASAAAAASAKRPSGGSKDEGRSQGFMFSAFYLFDIGHNS